MLHLPSCQTYLRLWLHLLHWPLSEKSAKQQHQALADQTASQRHHLALHRACKRFAVRYPEWVRRRFDAEFLRQMSSGPVLPSGPELAAALPAEGGSGRSSQPLVGHVRPRRHQFRPGQQRVDDDGAGRTDPGEAVGHCLCHHEWQRTYRHLSGSDSGRASDRQVGYAQPAPAQHGHSPGLYRCPASWLPGQSAASRH